MQLANTVTEKRAIALEILNNKNSIKGFFQELAFDEIESIYSKMTDVFNNIKEQNKLLQQQNEEKLNALKSIQADLEAKGLTLDDLISLTTHQPIQSIHSPRKKRVTKEQPQFSFTYLNNGKQDVYTGKATGNKPQAFKDYLEETGNELVDIVVAEDKARLVEFLAKK